MKHLLIASSMLALTAGFAAADTSTTFSGTLMFGIANNGTGNGGKSDTTTNTFTGDSVLKNDTYHVYSNIDLIATIAGTSDMGLSFGTSVDVSAGPSYALADDDGFNDHDGTFSSPAIFVTGAFGTVTFKSNDIDFYDDSAFNGGGDGGSGDFKYEGTFGGFFVGLITDIETGDMSAKTSYNLMGVALSADYSMNGASVALWNASAGYNFSMFNFALSADNDTDSNDVEYGLKLGATVVGVDAFVKYNFHPNLADGTVQEASYDVGATYTSGPITLTAVANNVTEANGTVNGIEWTVSGDYAMASGVTFQAGMNYTGDMMLGAKFAF